MDNSLLQDTSPFLKQAFLVTLGVDFKTYEEQVLWATAVGSNGGVSVVDPVVKGMIDAAKSSDTGPKRIFYTRRKCRDTSLGGNDAFNCYYGYNEDDDVPHSFTKTDFGNSFMGRVYSEMIDDSQQIMYMSFGLPEYNSLFGFYENAVNSSLAAFMNRGSSFSISEVGKIAGNIAGAFIALPFLPLKFINWAAKRITSTRITKYTDFRPEPAMYNRFVNQMIIHTAVNLGLRKDGYVAGSSTSNQTTTQQYNQSLYYSESIPPIFRESNWDIYQIYQKRFEMQTGIKSSTRGVDTDQALLNAKTGSVDKDATSDEKWWKFGERSKTKNWMDSLYDSMKTGLQDGDTFIGIRIEKSVDTSESLSNQTGESPVAAAINQKVNEARNAYHTFAGGNVGDGAIAQGFEAMGKFVTGLASGALDSFGVGGISHLLMGAGYIDVPEVWVGSSFSKSYTFNMKLEAPYGDPITIMQSLYIPLFLILAGALPRAVGANAFTSPFFVQCYSKGMFAVPYGMIDSINVKRGGEQHGWSFQRLPLSLDVSFTIKDLSPALYMAMGGTGFLGEIFGEHTSFNEYLLTLSGMGLYERLSVIESLKRRANAAALGLWNTTLNPARLGMELANTTAGRLISVVVPSNGLPRN